ncbi:uncharacterized protein [Nicotiana sylvestris]|uniref:uncharacterized protein n=1 Tax=Nicotiana sylvestris TaxID=4096 RepID=UPI00388CE824
MREKCTRDYLPEDTLSFNDEDAEGIEQPDNDTLVISILMNKIQVKRVLIDPGSSTNIIRSRVVEQLDLQDQIVPATRVLNYFNMVSEITKEEIIFLVNMVGTIQETKFYVIEGDMRYNALLGRPWIHNLRAVPLTLHQVLKFPISEGIKMVYGKQLAAITHLPITFSKNCPPVLSTIPNNEHLLKAYDAQYYPSEVAHKVPNSYKQGPRDGPHISNEEFTGRKGRDGIPRRLKVPKFNLYDGCGDPVAHLMDYCNKMRSVGEKDDLLMAYFSESLTGAALEWHNRQDVGKWPTLGDMVQDFF